MAEILKISAGEEPSPYTNHVLVEQIGLAAFSASGVSNRDGALEYFMPPHKSDLAVMLKIAVAWADEQNIHFVHVRMQVNP